MGPALILRGPAVRVTSTSGRAEPCSCSRREPLAPAATLRRAPAGARRRAQPPRAVATALAGVETETLQRIEHYNRTMNERMQWDRRSPYEYHPEKGLYYSYILPDLVVGSQPRTKEDVDHIAERVGAKTILNLQQDKDMAYWGVDVSELRARADASGVALLRCPARDFDPHSLRHMLPAACRVLEESLCQGQRVYVHCTAGLGRAPAVAIAWLYWFGGMQLDEAYSFLTEVRPCGPKRDAVRGATYDLLSGRPWEHFQWEAEWGFATLSEADRQALRAKVMRAELPMV